MRNLAKHLPDSSGFDLKHILVEPGKPISLKKDFDPAYSGNFKDKEETLTELRLNIEQLAGQQDILYAERYVRPASGSPSPGRRRQRQHDQARDVRRKPARMRGVQF